MVGELVGAVDVLLGVPSVFGPALPDAIGLVDCDAVAVLSALTCVGEGPVVTALTSPAASAIRVQAAVAAYTSRLRWAPA